MLRRVGRRLRVVPSLVVLSVVRTTRGVRRRGRGAGRGATPRWREHGPRGVTWRSTSRDSSTPSRRAAEGVRCRSVRSGSVRRAESREAVGIRFLPATSPGAALRSGSRAGDLGRSAIRARRWLVAVTASMVVPTRWDRAATRISEPRFASRRARCRGAGRRTRASRGLRDGPCVNEPRTRADGWARVVAPRAIFVGRRSASRAALDARLPR